MGDPAVMRDVIDGDVGINRVEGKRVGHGDCESVLPVAPALTPVPGGGMTVGVRLTTTRRAFERSSAPSV